MATINNLEIAKKNFLLGIANGDTFEWAFESGTLFLDTDSEEKEYLKFCTDWKCGLVKGEIERYDFSNEKFYAQSV